MPQFSRLSSRSSFTVAGRKYIFDSTPTEPTEPYTFQGTVSGYTSGGAYFSIVSTVDKFPFASDTNASGVGNLTQARNTVAGQSSNSNGYTSGGNAPLATNTIDKFPFASDTNATDVGDLTQGRYGAAGQSSTQSGYTSGGRRISPPPTPPFVVNSIDKFPFSTNANASDVGDLTLGRYGLAGQSSADNGYTTGGRPPPGAGLNTIDKFPFATNANATDVGDLTQARYNPAGQSSETHGYTSGGTKFAPPFNAPPVGNYYQRTVDKFSFASNANATNVGNLTEGRTGGAGQSSTISGYTGGGYGGYVPGSYVPGNVNTIDKFPFSSDANASDVGDLSQTRAYAAGQQV
jgi:hypothetical protein